MNYVIGHKMCNAITCENSIKRGGDSYKGEKVYIYY